MTARLVVLISGSGSNLQAILDACSTGELDAQVVSVISNKADAYGLIRAKNAGVEAIYFPKQENESRREFDSRLADEVTSKQADYVVLAGWMRLLSSSFLSSFPNKVINIHPALPGMFPGTHAIERAFEAYQRGEIDHTGVMVHLVPDEGVDNGPVLATEIVLIGKSDTLETLEARMHQTEHRLLVNTMNKTGLVEFAQALADLGWTLLASGGTAKLLRDNQIAVTEVADYTKSPEILGGRVKTLHPAVHGGLLARPTEEDHQQLLDLGWDYIDLVAVNLYPFEETVAKPNVTYADAIENIDIGGVTLIRAAAKNHERVTLLCDPADYSSVLQELRAGGISSKTRARLAIKGFTSTAHYDTAIHDYLKKQAE
jgi:formyltetrahydrofolate-dependent phosphoribosylglycinamide formyltransferase